MKLIWTSLSDDLSTVSRFLILYLASLFLLSSLQSRIDYSVVNQIPSDQRLYFSEQFDIL